MELWEILVPTTWNDGTPIKLKHHKAWDKKVKAITGGLTLMTPAKGQWVSPTGANYDERVIPVRLAVNSTYVSSTVSGPNTAILPRPIGDIMRLTCEHYDQLAIMCYRVSDLVYIWNREWLIGDKPFWRKHSE